MQYFRYALMSVEIITLFDCVHTAQDIVGLHCCLTFNLLPTMTLTAFSTELLPREHKIKELESAVSVITVSLGPVRQSLVHLVKFMHQIALFHTWLNDT